MALKASDTDVIPLAPHIHEELHRGGYRAWEKKYGSQLAWLGRIQYLMKYRGIYQECFPYEDIPHQSGAKTEDDPERQVE
jgi:hypothetical protein